MQRIVSFLLVAVLVMATLPFAHAAYFSCYTCAGYDPGMAEDKLLNNKNCPQGNFKASAISTRTGDFCSTIVEELGGQQFTVRSSEWYAKMTKDNFTRAGSNYLTFRGYFCNMNYCNDKDSSAAPNSRTLWLPLLLLSLLTALPRCLA